MLRLQTKEKYHRSVGKISENLIVSYNQCKTQKAGVPKKPLDYLLVECRLLSPSGTESQILLASN